MIRRLWPRWVWANAWSELVGLGGSIALALLVLGPDSPAGVLAAAAGMIVVAAVLEGGVVGVAQWGVLRRALPRLDARRWIGATALGAFTAWTLGMIPGTVISMGEAVGSGAAPAIGSGLMMALAFLMGLLLGPVLAFFQWRVLRRHVARAVWWIPANAVAWGTGMVILFAGSGLLSEGASVPVVAAVLAASCLAAGAAVGAIHGVALVWLLSGDSRPANDAGSRRAVPAPPAVAP
jgi:hypothetical protein